MAYIGREPQIGKFQVCDAISVVNGQAAYTMQVDSTNVSPETANHMIVSLNGVLQKPGSSFTVSGSTITFASNLVTGDVIDFIHILGSVLDLGVPSDATVTNAKTNFVSTSSAAGLQIKGDGTTDGTLQLNCSQNSHGIKLKSPAHSTSSSYTLTFPGTDPSADKFLKTDGSGNLSFADAGGGITEADMWRISANTSGATGVFTSNWERADSYGFSHLGTGMTESSGVFTFPSTGFWRVSFHGNLGGKAIEYAGLLISATTDGTNYNHYVKNYANASSSGYELSVFVDALFDITNTSTHKIRFEQQQASSGGTWSGDTNMQRIGATFIRLGDT